MGIVQIWYEVQPMKHKRVIHKHRRAMNTKHKLKKNPPLFMSFQLFSLHTNFAIWYFKRCDIRHKKKTKCN